MIITPTARTGSMRPNEATKDEESLGDSVARNLSWTATF